MPDNAPRGIPTSARRPTLRSPDLPPKSPNAEAAAPPGVRSSEALRDREAAHPALDVEWLDYVKEQGWDEERARKEWSMREHDKTLPAIDVRTMDTRRKNAASAAMKKHGYKTEPEEE